MFEKYPRTGFYDNTGKAICDRDKIKVRYGQEILIGTVQAIANVDGGRDWILYHPCFGYGLKNLDDIEILEEV